MFFPLWRENMGFVRLARNCSSSKIIPTHIFVTRYKIKHKSLNNVTMSADHRTRPRSKTQTGGHRSTRDRQYSKELDAANERFNSQRDPLVLSGGLRLGGLGGRPSPLRGITEGQMPLLDSSRGACGFGDPNKPIGQGRGTRIGLGGQISLGEMSGRSRIPEGLEGLTGDPTGSSFGARTENILLLDLAGLQVPSLVFSKAGGRREPVNRMRNKNKEKGIAGAQGSEVTFRKAAKFGKDSSSPVPEQKSHKNTDIQRSVSKPGPAGRLDTKVLKKAPNANQVASQDGVTGVKCSRALHD